MNRRLHDSTEEAHKHACCPGMVCVCDAGQCQHESLMVFWCSNLYSCVLSQHFEASANAMSNAVNKCEYIGNEFVNYMCVSVTGGPSGLTEPQLKSCSEKGGAC